MAPGVRTLRIQPARPRRAGRTRARQALPRHRERRLLPAPGGLEGAQCFRRPRQLVIGFLQAPVEEQLELHHGDPESILSHLTLRVPIEEVCQLGCSSGDGGEAIEDGTVDAACHAWRP